MSATLINNVNLFPKICRICLETNTTLQNIFSLSLNTVIIECTTVEISLDDGLPQMVCENCIIMAKQAIQFKAQCENSDKILRKMLKDSFTNVRNNEIAEDPLYIHQTDLSLETTTKTTECVEIKLENNCESTGNTNHNEVFEEAEVKSVVIKSEEVQDLNTMTKSNVNDTSDKPSRKRKKALTKRFNCAICKNHFPKIRDLSKHIADTHEERPFKCDYCESTFNLEVRLKHHMKIHTGEKRFCCSCCEKKFITKAELDSHSWQHKSKDERPFLCSLCGKKVIDKHRLDLHMETHQKGNYQCELCSNSYPTPKSLKCHLRIHTGERRVICSVCGLQLASPFSLKNHMRSHNKESENDRPFSCPHCPKKFYTKAVLKKHVFIHTGEKKYICTVCKEAFTQDCTLMNHMWIHKGGYPFRCDVCGQRFRRNNFLLEHKKKRHQEIPFALDDKK